MKENQDRKGDKDHKETDGEIYKWSSTVHRNSKKLSKTTGETYLVQKTYLASFV